MRYLTLLLVAGLLIAAAAGCSRRSKSATPEWTSTEKLPPEVEGDPADAARMPEKASRDR